MCSNNTWILNNSCGSRLQLVDFHSTLSTSLERLQHTQQPLILQFLTTVVLVLQSAYVFGRFYVFCDAICVSPSCLISDVVLLNEYFSTFAFTIWHYCKAPQIHLYVLTVCTLHDICIWKGKSYETLKCSNVCLFYFVITRVVNIIHRSFILSLDLAFLLCICLLFYVACCFSIVVDM